MFDKLGHGRISRLFKENLGKTVPYQHRVNDYFWGSRGALRQHFGPKARIPELFERRDRVYFALEKQKLKWYAPAPSPHHDLLDAAARVGRVEESIGYTFKHKLYCIEALKQTNSTTPLYFQGVAINTDNNRRLALLGDRALDLALSEIWFYTGNTLADYTAMSLKTVTRAALNTQGLKINLDKNLILVAGATGATPNQVAETFEALLGAVYVDSGHDVEAVKRVINTVQLDQNRFLRRDDNGIAERERKENAAQQWVESIEREQDQKIIAASRKKAELQRKGNAAQTESMKKNANDQSKTTWTNLFSQFLYGVQPQTQLDKDTVDSTKQRPLKTPPEAEKSHSANLADRATTKVESTTIGDYLRQYTQKLLGQKTLSIKQRRKEARKERERMKLLQEQENKERQREKDKEIALQKAKKQEIQKEKEKQKEHEAHIKELEAQEKRKLEDHRNKELKAQRQKELKAQKKRDLEAQIQQELEAQKQQELGAQKQQEVELQKQQEVELQKQQEVELQKQQEQQAREKQELESQAQQDSRAQEEKRLEARTHKEPDTQVEELVFQTQKEPDIQEEEKKLVVQTHKEPDTQVEEPVVQTQKESDTQEEEKELEAGAQNDFNVQEEKELEILVQNVSEAQEKKEYEDQKHTELEARKQNDEEQHIQKEQEDQSEQEKPSKRESKEREWQKEELKAGRQEDEVPLPAGLRQHAWNVANTKAATLKKRGKPCHVYALFQEQLAEAILRQRQGSKRLERRVKLREQRRIKFHEDSPEVSPPESTQEETTVAPVTSHEEELVTAPVSKQEQVQPLEIRQPVKSVSPVQKKSIPNVEKNIKQMETELIQEHQRAWQKAGTDTSKPEPQEDDYAPLRRPLKMARMRRRSLAASIEQLNEKESSSSSEEGNSHQAEVQVLPTADVVGVAMRTDAVHGERANDRS
ncbi:Rnc dsRNA-specific ribonuclease [Pyrenophora teres f. maculata]|nr:Rnc dsRNA-specific ribonuclease [Pyrenophora teres f. maculata]